MSDQASKSAVATMPTSRRFAVVARANIRASEAVISTICQVGLAL